MVKILKYRTFDQWAQSERLTDKGLREAILQIEQGLFDANLGGGLYKKRIARKGQGKSGGYRTLIAFKKGGRAVFMYGFSKSERANISLKEKDVYKRLARYYLEVTEAQLVCLVERGELIEVTA